MGYCNPIVALTANALIGQAEVFLNSGFDGFLSKPIQTVHLNGILNKYIREGQPPEVIAAARASADNSKMQEINGFMNREMAKLKKDFYFGQRNTARDIRSAIAVSDFETAQRLAHTLKGLAGFIEEDELAKSAGKIEKLLSSKSAPKEELDIMERRLAKIIKGIEEALKHDVPTAAGGTISDSERTALLDTLGTLLADSDGACLELTDELAKIPETKVLIKQIEDCSFEEALITLNTMRTVLEI
jgi:HPt (histidine-containing phosphotransfer) domain-containing protein